MKRRSFFSAMAKAAAIVALAPQLAFRVPTRAAAFTPAGEPFHADFDVKCLGSSNDSFYDFLLRQQRIVVLERFNAGERGFVGRSEARAQVKVLSEQELKRLFGIT